MSWKQLLAQRKVQLHTTSKQMMGRRGVAVYSRALVYRNKTLQVPGFGPCTFRDGEEKGIDVRLALDALDAAHQEDHGRHFDQEIIVLCIRWYLTFNLSYLRPLLWPSSIR